MADEKKMTVDELAPGNGGWKNKISKKSLRIFLIVSLSVLVVALAASAVFLIGMQDRVVRVMDYGTALDGISVDGIDISGMTGEEALAATADIQDRLLQEVKLSVDLNGEAYEFMAEDIGIATDYDEVISGALMYGHVGTFDERKTAADTAKSDGVDFVVDVVADEQTVLAALNAIKNEIDAEPKDATFVFMPNGYYMVEGVAYDALEYEELLEEQGVDIDDVEGLERVMLAEADHPNALRYQYYNDDYYEGELEDIIPEDAYVARFYYIEEVTGVVIDMDYVAAQVLSAVENDDLTAAITAPTELTEPVVTLEQIKAQTQLVASWTSSYRDHNSKNRIKNVEKLSGIINGVEILPGAEWSINDEAGARTTGNGWWIAAGISGGAYTDQAGGGVCQISSTTYNAALRTGLTIVDKSNHSIISDYIPVGLDATISTGHPDLVLGNPNETSIYIVSYMNKGGKNVTVEMYGVPVVDDTYGEVILDFTNANRRNGATPETTYIYNKTQLPDGTLIGEGETKTWVKPRSSTRIDVYKHILDLEGNELEKVFLEEVYYRSYKGVSYVNDVDPAEPTPTPDPSGSPAPTPTPPAGTPTP